MQSNHHKNIAAIIHLSALSKFIFPLGNFIMPLLFWTLNKDKSEFIDAHGKQIINFQISIFLYTIIIGAISIPLLILGILDHVLLPEIWHSFPYGFKLEMYDFHGIKIALFICILLVLVVITMLFEIVFIILATSKANDGKYFKYPITISFLK
ncbi:MAG: DUF4870 domain-containing protein [Flavobacteriaceae bacterium]|nr:DUF4870 domain-containing protein [Flavobacteriaceae bacterium]